MARKRKKLKHLDYESSAYWDNLLRLEGLSMEKGLNAKLTYLGGSSTLESIDGENFTYSGRIPPKAQVE